MPGRYGDTGPILSVGALGLSAPNPITSNGGQIPIPFDVAQAQGDDWVSVPPAPFALVVPRNGLYLVSAFVKLSATVDTAIDCDILLNAGAFASERVAADPTNGTAFASVTLLAGLAAGDVLTAFAACEDAAPGALTYTAALSAVAMQVP